MVESIIVLSFSSVLVYDRLQAELLNVGNCWPNLSVSGESLLGLAA